jgi:hypothetical protein
MRASGFMADLLVWSVLAASIVWAPADPRALVLVLALVALTWVPWVSRSAGEGGLGLDQGLVLLSLFLLSWPLTLPASRGFLFITAIAGFACISGLVIATIRRRETGKWVSSRMTVFLASLVAILATVSMAGAARALLALRSTSPLVPGRLDFVWPMLVWAGIWFGLDAHFRDRVVSKKKGVAGWFRDRRHGMGVAVAAVVLLCGAG